MLSLRGIIRAPKGPLKVSLRGLSGASSLSLRGPLEGPKGALSGGHLSKIMGETGERRQEKGDRRQEKGDRRQAFDCEASV